MWNYWIESSGDSLTGHRLTGYCASGDNLTGDLLTWGIFAAFVLDIICGDPQWLPHPVRFIGTLAGLLENVLVRCLGRTSVAGVVFTLLVVGATWMTTAALVAWSWQWDWRCGMIVEIVILYTTLAARDLDHECRTVFAALGDGDLPLARRNLSRIVGRDTDGLDEREIVRATVETMAENTVDGVVSPLFFAFVGGAPLAMTFKAINTLDSMVGHKTDRYLRFGWASARLDDAANFGPARLSRLLFPVAAWICGLDSAGCRRIVRRDGQKSPSPNAGISEAAVAGALGVQLGGVNYYRGEQSVRPLLGDPLNPLHRDDVLRATRLMYTVSVLTLFVGMTARSIACRVWS